MVISPNKFQYNSRKNRAKRTHTQSIRTMWTKCKKLKQWINGSLDNLFCIRWAQASNWRRRYISSEINIIFFLHSFHIRNSRFSAWHLRGLENVLRKSNLDECTRTLVAYDQAILYKCPYQLDCLPFDMSILDFDSEKRLGKCIVVSAVANAHTRASKRNSTTRNIGKHWWRP